ncbi:hypothetical protein Tco_1340442, partial [Tanacetum coccineum]
MSEMRYGFFAFPTPMGVVRLEICLQAFLRRPSSVGLIISKMKEIFIVSCDHQGICYRRRFELKAIFVFHDGELGELKETKPRCIFRGFVSFQISRESMMFPVCSAGRTIGFWNPAKLGEECSRRLLRKDDGFGPKLAEDEASSLK